MFYISWDFSC